ncbi:MAG: 2-C-methyl-D-erythritol 4-phosphate cytidylyltransferase [Comamonas sp.]
MTAASVPSTPVARQPRLWPLVPCAGVGSRAAEGQADKSLPKQYQPLAGRPLVAHTLAALAAVARLQPALVVVAPQDGWAAPLLADADGLAGCGAQLAFCGGDTRAQSVLNGLDHLLAHGARDDDWVLVHDAARCLVLPQQIDRLIDACRDDPAGGLLALPLPDTLKAADASGRVAATLPRTGKWLAQTPQMFRLGLLRQALRQAPALGVTVTDEASAIEALGLSPRLVEGSARNFKVTYAGDFALAEAVLAAQGAGR